MSEQIYRLYPGTNGQYRALHNWVDRKLGKPRECDLCGTTEPVRYEWSNISGEYLKDTSDWRRLCVTCHRRADMGGKCKSGKHDSTEENIYTYPGTGRRVCHPCKKLFQRKYKEDIKYERNK